MGHALILGGARSGKTAFAERMTLGLGRRPAYLATAQAWDEEMAARIAAHRTARAADFATIEEPLDLPAALRAAAGTHDAVLVDCLTMWITNLMGAARDVEAAIAELAATLETISDMRVVLVSNEVGLGIVPDNALARRFRDLAGLAHQRLAARCTHVHLVVAGLGMRLKG